MSNEKQHIDNFINSSFETDKPEQMDFDWSNMKSKLDSKSSIDKLVYSALKPVPTELPNSGWDNMNDALDIETVWKRLEKRPRKKPFLFWWSMAGIFIIAGIFIYTFSLENKGSLSESNLVLENPHNNRNFSKNKNRNELLNKEIEYDQSLFSTVELFGDSSIHQEYDGFKIIDIESQEFEDNAFKIKPFDKKHIQKLALNPIEPILRIFDAKQSLTPDTVNLTRQENNSKKWNIGLIGGINNTWILDTDTRLGFKKKSLIYNDVTMVPVLGAFAEYRFNNNFGFQSQLFFNSSLKTKLHLYEEGNLVNRETNLDYLTVTFLAVKYIPLKESTVNFSAGFYGSYLKGSSEKNDGIITEINSNYTQLDYGAKIDLSHQYRFKFISISYGLDASYGFPNIFTGTSHLPSYLNKTRTIVIGANLKLGYQF